MLATVIGIIMLLSGFVIGHQQAELRASRLYVSMEQYNRDINEIKADLKQLLRFHMESEHEN